MSVVGYNPDFAVNKVNASVVFDGGAPIDTQTMVLCPSSSGASPTAGFGAACNGTVVQETIPIAAQPGS
jgi:hypothetical protein